MSETLVPSGSSENGPPPQEAWIRRVAMACFAFVGALALLVLVSWLTGQWHASALGREYVPVAPSTALLFLGLSIAAFSRQRRPRSALANRFCQGIVLLTFAVSCLALAQSAFGFRFAIEEWFTRTAEPVGKFVVGVMSPLTAAVFLLAALGLLLQIEPCSRTRRYRQAAAVLALAVLVLDLGVLLGYALQVPVLYGGTAVPMAAVTALAFVLLGAGLMLTAGLDLWPLILFVSNSARTTSRRASLGGLLAVFLLFAMAIGATGYFYFERRRDEARRDAYAVLTAIADLQSAANQAMWRGERLSDAAAMAGNPLACEAAARVIEGTADPATRERVRQWLASLQVYAGYRSVALANGAGGTVLFAGEAGGLGDMARHGLEEALASGKPVFLDLHAAHEVSFNHLGLIVPLKAVGQGRPAGAVIIRIDPAASLYPILAAWPVPTKTGETLLVRREGDGILFLSPLRFARDAPLHLHRSLSTSGLPASMAVSGKAGGVEGRDYAGRSVLASVRGIPDSPWFIVAKADRSELLARARQDALGIFLTALFLVLATGGVMTALWRHQAVATLRQEMDAERERHALVKHFEHLVKYANDIILLADAGGRYVEVNDTRPPNLRVHPRRNAGPEFRRHPGAPGPRGPGPNPTGSRDGGGSRGSVRDPAPAQGRERVPRGGQRARNRNRRRSLLPGHRAGHHGAEEGLGGAPDRHRVPPHREREPGDARPHPGGDGFHPGKVGL